MNIKQHTVNSIDVNQHSYSGTIQPMKFEKHKPDSYPLTPTEKTDFRSTVGQISWLAGITRPDQSFEVCQLSASAKEATIGDAKLLNKAVKRAQSEKVSIRYPPLNLNDLKILCYSDASYANLPKEGCQGGNIILLTNGT